MKNDSQRIDEVTVLSFKNQRVLTSSQLAQIYGVKGQNITRNFCRNSSRYVYGKHFFSVSGEEKHDLRRKYEDLDVIPINAENAYLWTFEGCILQANSLRNVPLQSIYKVAELFGIDTDRLVIAGDASKEWQFISTLKSILPESVRVIEQFSVKPFRLDAFLPEFRIAIEFDEAHHTYHRISDKRREKEIESVLGPVQFIRVSETDIFSGIRNVIEAITGPITVQNPQKGVIAQC